ncbi:hypothetical protein [Mesorhizobium sp.]|uniref:hypothetical protein n=1 Tax=Mesorhizobium sp. TaxID=1871066 RepID=UPI0025EB427D|nr:hypothetical protein [Mesorhizobium sp.]
MRKQLQLLLVASLCGCVSPAPQPDAGAQRVNPVPISLALEEIITTGVRQHLQEPANAKFGSMVAGERTLNGRGEILVCGHVNAKGPTGSYGDKLFAARIYPDAGSAFELVAIGDQPADMSLVNGTCRAAGLATPDRG